MLSATVELKVFVANMTGNVIILGLGFGGSGNVTGPAASTLFFCVGAAAGGHLAFARAAHRGVLLGTATIVQTGLLVAAALIETSSGHVDRLERHVLIAALAAAMGWQFAIVRRVGVPDYPTVVVTSRSPGWSPTRSSRGTGPCAGRCRWARSWRARRRVRC